MTLPACPICQSASMPAFAAGEHRMFRCQSCHTAFVHPMPDDEYLADFYSRFHRSDEEGGTYGQFEERMEADFPVKVQEVIAGCGGGTIRLLDVGCGKGYFVKACRERGIDATGIDYSDTAVKFAQEQLRVPATCGKVEDLAQTVGPFDAVTFWATIEHLPNPLATLRAIHRTLKPGGLLFLDTGLGHDLLDRVLPGVVQWYDPPQHLFVFSIQGMRLAMRQCGFDVIRIDPCFERSPLRRFARKTRNLLAATCLRTVATLAQLRAGPFPFTRFPLGNLMAVTARATSDPSR